MTDTKQSYTEPVAGLMRLGDVRPELGWRDYLALGFTEQHIPDLCRMILDKDLFWAETERDEVWSAIHAWRTLAQLKSDSAIPCLIKLLGRVDEYDSDWTTEELPLVFSHLGRAALAPLRTFLADTDQGMWSRLAAATSLVKLAERDPELRDESVAALSRQLENFARQDPNFNALLISALVDLHAASAAPVIEQAFAANQVDLMLQGDWEEVQIALGLLSRRTTPPPDYRSLMAAQMGFDPTELLDHLKLATQAGLPRKAERNAEGKARAKTKAKRKQAKQSRKKQRKRK